jgi:hypothetical protein
MNMTFEENLSNPDSKWRKIILDCHLFLSIKSPSDVILANLTTGYMNSKVSEQAIRRALDKNEYAHFIQKQTLVAEFIYNPHAKQMLDYNAEGGETFNTYQPPTWKKDSYFFQQPLPEAPTSLTPIMDKYLTHLVAGDAASKEYILDWLATALRSRNFTILTAIGEPGIGKGVLGEIMSKLVGSANFTRVRDTVFKKQFNAPLKNKQIVYVDEVSLTSNEEIDRVKDVVNARIEIEQKGLDSEEVDNHASFYLTSNRMDAIKIESSDRRFSIIQLTDERLLKVFAKSEIPLISSDKEIEALALYLLNREIKSDMYEPFRSQRYEEVLEAGLAEWELYLAETYLPSKAVDTEVPLEELKEEISRAFEHLNRPPGRHRIEAFVRKFSTHLKIERAGGVRKIKILKKFEARK